MSSKYNDDDDDIKILLEHTLEHGNDIFHYDYDHVPETRAEPIPEPKPDTPKDDD